MEYGLLMKRSLHLTLGCAAALACSTTLAFTHTPYVGAGGGMDYGGWNYGSNVVSDNAVRKYVTPKGWQWTVFGGYQLTFKQRFQLAAEVFGGKVNSKSKLQAQQLGANNITYNISSNVGIAAVPAILVHDQSVFIKAGAEWSKVNYHTNAPAVPGAPGLDPSSYNQGKWQTGYLIGTGISAPLMPYLSVRTEYDYSRFGKVNLISTINTGLNAATLYLKPRQSTYWVSLILHRPTKTDDNTPAPKRGLFFGVGAGRDVFRVASNNTSTDAETTRRLGGRGYNVRGITGYDYHLFKYFVNTVAATASYSTSRFVNDASNDPIFDAKVRMRDLYSIRDQFGYKTSTHNILYALWGAALAKFTKTATPQAVAADGENFSHYRRGWVWGVGDQLSINKHVSYAIEGDYFYGFKSFHLSPGTNDSSTNFLSPKVMRFSANLIYTF